MRVLPGWCVVEVVDKKKEGDFYLPETAKKDMHQGTIIALPEEKYFVESGILNDVPKDLAVGQKVAFKKYFDTDLEIEDKKYKVVHLENLLVILD